MTNSPCFMGLEGPPVLVAGLPLKIARQASIKSKVLTGSVHIVFKVSMGKVKIQGHGRNLWTSYSQLCDLDHMKCSAKEPKGPLEHRAQVQRKRAKMVASQSWYAAAH